MSEKEIEDVDWKWLNEEKLYKVYRVGKIYSIFTNSFLNPYFDTNRKYYELRLKINNKLKRLFLHILITDLFIDKLSKKKNVIVFKDNNEKNCNADNLKIVSRKNFINADNNNKKTQNIIKNKNNDKHLENIEWKYLNEEQKYKIYKDGKVFANLRNKYLKPRMCNNRLIVDVRIDNKDMIINIKNTVYSLFKGDIGLYNIVEHIDKNIKNNHIDNLKLIRKKDIVKDIKYDKEIWKPVLGYEKNYIINKNADVFSLKRGKYKIDNFNIKFNKNYKKLTMFSDNKKIKQIPLHRLVYSTFANKDLSEFGDNVIDHIDRNSFNNNFENLRLVTISENNKNIDRTKPKENKIIIPKSNNFTNILGNHKGIDLSNYLINEFGDIKNKLTNKIKIPHNHLNYLTVSIKNKSLFVHKLIAATFIDNPNNLNVVNHKDRNRSNNNLSNLEWIDLKGNVQHAVGIKVIKINLEGDIIKTYNSIRDAALDTKNNKGNKSLNNAKLIHKVCKGIKISIYGFKWKFYDDLTEEEKQSISTN